MVEADQAVGIKALGPDGLERLLSDMGQPGFRAAQIMRWLYGRGARSWEEMTDLPQTLRETLADEWPVTAPTLADKQISTIDDTRKYLWRLADGSHVESVGLPTGDRLTVCFSTQAGCGMGCSFCATGAGGLVRNLFAGEIVDQVRLVGDDFGRRVSNAVAMGQGEPFANYEPTLGGLRLINSPDGLGIGARHLTVSTCGLIPPILRFAEEPEQFTLAVSLHSAVQSTRDRIMPGLSSQPLSGLLDALRTYTTSTSRRVSIEYALIEGVNDTDPEIEALVGFASGLLCHVNLIPVNPVTGAQLPRPQRSRAETIARTLSAHHIETTIRAERGADIDAACGQLSQRHSAADR